MSVGSVFNRCSSFASRTVVIAALILSAAGCDRDRDHDRGRAPAPAPDNAAPRAPAATGAAEPPAATAPAAASAASPQASSAAPAAPEPAPSEDAVAKLIAPWKGDLDGMIERRYIRILVTFSKTNYFLDGPEQRGATYEAGKMFEDFVNKSLKSKNIKLHVAFIPVSRDRLFDALIEGRGDIAAATLTVTPARQARVEFSTPVARDVREVVVTAPGQPPVATANDLAGREVYVRRSSAYYDSLTALNASLHAAGKPPVRITAASEQLEDEDILEMVNAGLVPATVVDNHLAEFWSQIFDQVSVHDGAAVRTEGQIAWAMRKETPKLRDMVNAFIAANQKGTLTYNVIYRKYFKDTKWVRNAAAESERRKFLQMRDLFREYGAKYDLPWLLLAAQGYQESQLDQATRSSAGAVGVMQIKPSTASGPPIGIQGVDKSAERNIHAGVKYLRFIVDQYYKDEPMTRVNKGLFAIASYNAGPARIAQLRRKASRMGLDPNQWFGNVEVVAAREIGTETVQYVSNIYKYYVSYNLIAQQAKARREARGES
jgi:membrane-bound lytic murein transglycosylase MltF